jgi:hypothetical protein
MTGEQVFSATFAVEYIALIMKRVPKTIIKSHVFFDEVPSIQRLKGSRWKLARG